MKFEGLYDFNDEWALGKTEDQFFWEFKDVADYYPLEKELKRDAQGDIIYQDGEPVFEIVSGAEAKREEKLRQAYRDIVAYNASKKEKADAPAPAPELTRKKIRQGEAPTVTAPSM